mmetsp:Transcript_1322/g.1692  ORF Transcript_1322/g.1692 Transcript_1322/m.1692 type:complete len:515 (-) Transcript_1322:1165-2709(-)
MRSGERHDQPELWLRRCMLRMRLVDQKFYVGGAVLLVVVYLLVVRGKSNQYVESINLREPGEKVIFTAHSFQVDKDTSIVRPPPGYTKVSANIKGNVFGLDMSGCGARVQAWPLEHLLNKQRNGGCSTLLDVRSLLCDLKCPPRDPELEKTVEILGIAKYRLHGLLRLCKAGAIPFLVRIKDNQISYYKCKKKPSGKRVFSTSMGFILLITCLVKLPDLVFGFDGNDYAVPQVESPLKYTSSGWIHPLPGVLRVVGTDAQPSLLFPTPPYLKDVGFCALAMRKLEPPYDQVRICPRATYKKWEEKSDAIFWRGGSTGMPFDYDFIYQMPRPAMVHKVHKEKHFDVGFTTLDGVSSKMREEGFMQKIRVVSMVQSDHFGDYRYLLHVDGNTASWGLSKKLRMGSLILWHESPVTFREHYYKWLEPWKHYVPIRKDFGNILPIRDWLFSPGGEGEAKQIKSQLEALVQERFRPEDALCYTIRLLYSLETMQDFDPAADLEPTMKELGLNIDMFESI